MSRAAGSLAYWGTPSGSEIDFVWTGGSRAIGIEVKASTRWRSEHGRELSELASDGVLNRAFAVYLGRAVLKSGRVEVLPVGTFLQR